MPMDLAIVATTYGSGAEARAEARRLVGARLAACASLVPVTSVYEWDGAMREDGEVMALFKTTAGAAPALREAMLAGHPYDTPEAITLGAESAGPYMEWVAGCVSGGKAQQRDDASEA